jgi:hypothetical protein
MSSSIAGKDEVTKSSPPESKGANVKMAPNPFPVEELYVDGITGITGRGGVLKMDCYRVAGVDKKDQSEIRQVTHRLVLPVVALAELAQAMQQVKETVKQAKQKES